jgi:hypothetical protein
METNGMYGFTVSATPTQVCEFCGESHFGPRCHYVKKLERYESGSVKMVEFFSSEEMNPARYVNVPYVSPFTPPPRGFEFNSNTPIGGPYVTSEAIARGAFDQTTVTISDTQGLVWETPGTTARGAFGPAVTGDGTYGGNFAITDPRGPTVSVSDSAVRDYEAWRWGGTSGGNFDFARIQDYVGRSNDAATQAAIARMVEDSLEALSLTPPPSGASDA